jgi:bifunctional DNA-binding transcriptional regulator/antitoxin component of YhaV-PrlF toxin-antitoxin module
VIAPGKEFPHRHRTRQGNSMNARKLTSKAQTTIPKAIRRVLAVGAGDKVAYAIEDGHCRATIKVRLRDNQGETFSLGLR